MKSCGVLNDLQIRNFAEKNQLICENFDPSNIKQACYELRVGSCYYDLSKNGEKVTMESNEFVIIQPHQSVVIITKEKLDLPSNVMGHIISKGSLFSLGILPVCTYADPGFYGKLGLVLHNSSNEYLKLSQNEPIAKISFHTLTDPVSFSYHGQHGYESGLWPIKTDEHVLSEKEVKDLLPRYSEIDEVRNAFGDKVGNLFERIQIAEKKFLIATIIYFIVNLLLIGVILFLGLGLEWFNPIFSVLIGIASNIIYALISYLIHHKKRK